MEPRATLDQILASLPLGFARVRANGGCAGADGVSIGEFARDLDAELFTLEHELRTGTYRPLPLRRVLVAKRDGSPRQLCIPAVRDRTAQAAALEILNPLFEREFEDVSFGFRRGRGVRDAVHRLRELHELQHYDWVVEADIDAFFDNVSHALVLDRIRRLIADRAIVDLVASWIRTMIWDGAAIYPASCGLPQGSAISPALANLLLDSLDEELLAAGQQLVRYADDFVIVCKTHADAAHAVALTQRALTELELAADELTITSFDEGFTFLGVTFLRSLAVLPYDPPARERKVIFMPPPLDPGQLARWRLAGWAATQSSERPASRR